MAQGRSADGLLRPSSKLASAGFLPALATALVIALAGCGGGSADSSTSVSTANGGAGASGRADSARARPEKGATGSGKSQGGGPKVAVPKKGREPGISPAQRKEATVANIKVASPVLNPSGNGVAGLPAKFTCDGEDVPPPLTWRGVPSGTAELVLFTMGLKPVNGKLFFAWAVAGLDPSLDGLASGRLPPGAVTGRNGFGRSAYSICPAKGDEEIYYFTLMALPKALSPKQGFDPRELRERALALSGSAGVVGAAYTH